MQHFWHLFIAAVPYYIAESIRERQRAAERIQKNTNTKQKCSKIFLPEYYWIKHNITQAQFEFHSGQMCSCINWNWDVLTQSKRSHSLWLSPLSSIIFPKPFSLILSMLDILFCAYDECSPPHHMWAEHEPCCLHDFPFVLIPFFDLILFLELSSFILSSSTHTRTHIIDTHTHTEQKHTLSLCVSLHIFGNIRD